VKRPAISAGTAAIEIVREAGVQVLVGASESREARRVQPLADHEKNLNWERMKRHLGS
jgi:hypothetical protein